MSRLSATLVGALVGGGAGYWLGVTIGCDWLIPASNLCGIYTVFTMPLGLALGAIFGWRMSRPKAD